MKKQSFFQVLEVVFFSLLLFKFFSFVPLIFHDYWLYVPFFHRKRMFVVPLRWNKNHFGTKEVRNLWSCQWKWKPVPWNLDEKTKLFPSLGGSVFSLLLFKFFSFVPLIFHDYWLYVPFFHRKRMFVVPLRWNKNHFGTKEVRNLWFCQWKWKPVAWNLDEKTKLFPSLGGSVFSLLLFKFFSFVPLIFHDYWLYVPFFHRKRMFVVPLRWNKNHFGTKEVRNLWFCQWKWKPVAWNLDEKTKFFPSLGGSVFSLLLFKFFSFVSLIFHDYWLYVPFFHRKRMFVVPLRWNKNQFGTKEVRNLWFCQWKWKPVAWNLDEKTKIFPSLGGSVFFPSSF